jgi:hypothetical protein
LRLVALAALPLLTLPKHQPQQRLRLLRLLLPRLLLRLLPMRQVQVQVM